MSSYVNKKTRVFRTIADILLEPRRSNARMKTYPSAIDARAWCDIREDRRQHILELVKHGYSQMQGKLLPYDILVQFLLQHGQSDKSTSKSNVKSEIGKLKQRLQGRRSKEFGGKRSSGQFSGPAGEGPSLDYDGDMEDSGSSTVTGIPVRQRKDICICPKMQRPRSAATSSIPNISGLFEECACGADCPAMNLQRELPYLSPRAAKFPANLRYAHPVNGELNPPCENCPIKKIGQIENQLQLKKKRTKQKIDILKTTLERFKRQLELERQRNNNLISRYSNQTKAVECMQTEIYHAKKESCYDKQKLSEINSALKKILAENEAMHCDSSTTSTCLTQVKRQTRPRCKQRSRTPHIHAQINLVTMENRYKHNCTINTEAQPLNFCQSCCPLDIEE